MQIRETLRTHMQQCSLGKWKRVAGGRGKMESWEKAEKKYIHNNSINFSLLNCRHCLGKVATALRLVWCGGGGTGGSGGGCGAWVEASGWLWWHGVDWLRRQCQFAYSIGRSAAAESVARLTLIQLVLVSFYLFLSFFLHLFLSLSSSHSLSFSLLNSYSLI